ncbi:MAG TPA: cytidylate kinase-like family protein [Gemmatimonadales bacterium]|nr:cytidylate kinase-like family protein [Gemmatimonadales bacterium]
MTDEATGMLITISRQYGAGGSAVAARVAATLGWRVVDNELVERVAARAGLTPEDVAQREERVSTFIERLARTVVAATPELVVPPDAAGTAATLSEADLVRLTERVVEEVAAEGRVVLVGRAAPAVLARERDAIHVKVVAPRDWRIRTVVERLGVSAEEAAGLTDETDRNRSRYHRQHYHRDWGDPANYHLVLNTAALGLDGAAEVIVGRARALGWV